eukprot:3527686-Pyramimonas_sp.AAC.1
MASHRKHVDRISAFYSAREESRTGIRTEVRADEKAQMKYEEIARQGQQFGTALKNRAADSEMLSWGLSQVASAGVTVDGAQTPEEFNSRVAACNASLRAAGKARVPAAQLGSLPAPEVSALSIQAMQLSTAGGASAAQTVDEIMARADPLPTSRKKRNTAAGYREETGETGSEM